MARVRAEEARRAQIRYGGPRCRGLLGALEGLSDEDGTDAEGSQQAAPQAMPSVLNSEPPAHPPHAPTSRAASSSTSQPSSSATQG
eukprot:3233813-Alexandrium_andersonii.AAC.1